MSGQELKKQAGVYRIICSANEQRYIGSSVNVYQRELKHFRLLRRGKHFNPHLQTAFDKYGETSFKFDVLFFCGPGNLIALEQMAMDAICPAFNVLQAASPRVGLRHSEETKAKIAATSLGRRHTPEARARISATLRGHTVSPETRDKLSIQRKGKPGFKLTPEQQAKRDASATGKKRTQEQRDRISAAHMGVRPTEETRAKMSAAHIGIRPTEETRAKMRNRKHTQEARDKIRAYWERRRIGQK